MHLSSSRLFLIATLVALSAAHAFGGLRYVDQRLASGANDGSSWSNAFQGSDGVRAALVSAIAGDQIWVARGTYKPTSTIIPSISFQLRNGVELYGGFAGAETLLAQRDVAANVTILDGDLNGSFSTHVVAAMATDGTAVLDGFTVRGGRASGGGSSGCGGGLFCQGGAGPTVRNCIFRNNLCSASGGAVYIENSGPTFLDTRFEFNAVTGSMTGPGRGGGVSLLFGGSTVFARCQFSWNQAVSGGGLAGGGSNVRITNCIFWNNIASANVQGPSGGGAMLIDGSVTIRDCTIVHNKSVTGTTGGILGFGAPTIANCIVYFNEGPGGATGLANNIDGADATYSCVQGGLAGAGNIGGDPLLVNVAGGDLRLISSSPCADAGSNALVPAGTTSDLYGNLRFVDNPAVADTGSGTAPIVDIGAYETPNTLYPSYCAGDGTLATACPCGNAGQPGRGCDNSAATGGALLAVAGSTAPDTLALASSGELSGATSVFLQGDASIASGIAFGDGVRCAGGSLKRLYVKSAVSGSASAPATGDPSISARSSALGDPIAPGSTRFYQVYYRDPNLAFCPAPAGASWNVTNGLIVSW